MTYLIALLVAWLSFGCGKEPVTTTTTAAAQKWELSELSLIKDGTFYATVTGKIKKLSGVATTETVKSQVAYYSDDYKTLIDTSDDLWGKDLASDSKQDVKVSDYKAYVKPATDGYAKVCATIKVPNSNFSDPQQVGCVDESTAQTK